MSYFDCYTPKGVFTIYERDEYDPLGDDRLRLYWDHPSFPGIWSVRFSWAPIVPDDEPQYPLEWYRQSNWTRDALARAFKLPAGVLAFDLESLSERRPMVAVPGSISTASLEFKQITSMRELQTIGPAELSVAQWRDALPSGPEAYSEEAQQIQLRLDTCNAELMKYLRRHPEALHTVHPGTFEAIVAEIFRDAGYDVEVLGQWNQPDGGVDILALRRDTLAGELRIAIQCKRFLRRSKVQADQVWALAGRLPKFKAHKGVIATTGRFGPSLIQDLVPNLWMIELYDFDRIAAALGSWRDAGGQ